MGEKREPYLKGILIQRQDASTFLLTHIEMNESILQYECEGYSTRGNLKNVLSEIDSLSCPTPPDIANIIIEYGEDDAGLWTFSPGQQYIQENIVMGKQFLGYQRELLPYLIAHQAKVYKGVHDSVEPAGPKKINKLTYMYLVGPSEEAIKHQRKQLQEYAKKTKLEIIGEFKDIIIDGRVHTEGSFGFGDLTTAIKATPQESMLLVSDWNNFPGGKPILYDLIYRLGQMDCSLVVMNSSKDEIDEIMDGYLEKIYRIHQGSDEQLGMFSSPDGQEMG